MATSTLGTRRLLARFPAWQVLLGGLACLAGGQLSIAITNGVRRQDQGLAGALLTTSQQTGAAVGLAILATAAAARTAQAGGSLVAGYRLSFLIGAGLMLLAGIVVTVQMRPRGRRHLDLHQASDGDTPSVSLAECQLRKC